MRAPSHMKPVGCSSWGLRGWGWGVGGAGLGVRGWGLVIEGGVDDWRVGLSCVCVVLYPDAFDPHP